MYSANNEWSKSDAEDSITDFPDPTLSGSPGSPTPLSLSLISFLIESSIMWLEVLHSAPILVQCVVYLTLPFVTTQSQRLPKLCCGPVSKQRLDNSSWTSHRPFKSTWLQVLPPLHTSSSSFSCLILGDCGPSLPPCPRAEILPGSESSLSHVPLLVSPLLLP